MAIYILIVIVLLELGTLTELLRIYSRRDPLWPSIGVIEGDRENWHWEVLWALWLCDYCIVDRMTDPLWWGRRWQCVCCSIAVAWWLECDDSEAWCEMTLGSEATPCVIPIVGWWIGDPPWLPHCSVFPCSVGIVLTSCVEPDLLYCYFGEPALCPSREERWHCIGSSGRYCYCIFYYYYYSVGGIIPTHCIIVLVEGPSPFLLVAQITF